MRKSDNNDPAKHSLQISKQLFVSSKANAQEPTSDSTTNMMSFHIQIASIFLLLVAFHLHQASTIALPIDPQTPPPTLLQPNPNLNISKLNELTVEQLVGNLVRAIAASPIRAVAETKLVAIMLRVDDNEEDITTSSNIASFRKIDVVFRHPRSGGGLRFSNRWPHHWDQWQNPLRDLVSLKLLPVAWDTLSVRMSVAWADQLLKIPPRPYRGAYGAVVAMQLTGRPLGWCFDALENADVSLLVDTTGLTTIRDDCLEHMPV
ncbi:MAG: hypothetical protein Q9226_007869 [Calogaya cf. arnoldii]